MKTPVCVHHGCVGTVDIERVAVNQSVEQCKVQHPYYLTYSILKYFESLGKSCGVKQPESDPNANSSNEGQCNL